MPANNSDMTVIHSAKTNKMYEIPTWWLFGNWYGCPPISSTWKPIGNITAAKQNSTTRTTTLSCFRHKNQHYSLAVKPTHLAYGMTFRSHCDEANSMMVVVIQIQPTKMHTKASNHSGWRSGVKHTCGRLYNVMQVHISPRRVSPLNKSYKSGFLVIFRGVYLQRQWWSSRALPNLRWRKYQPP